MSSTEKINQERARVLVDEKHEELIRNYRINWFHNNIQIKEGPRISLKLLLFRLCSNEKIAEAAWRSLAKGEYELEGKQSDEKHLKFVVDEARDLLQSEERDDNSYHISQN